VRGAYTKAPSTRFACVRKDTMTSAAQPYCTFRVPTAPKALPSASQPHPRMGALGDRQLLREAQGADARPVGAQHQALRFSKPEAGSLISCFFVGWAILKNPRVP
jgi:hypothetical protein